MKFFLQQVVSLVSLARTEVEVEDLVVADKVEAVEDMVVEVEAVVDMVEVETVVVDMVEVDTVVEVDMVVEDMVEVDMVEADMVVAEDLEEEAKAAAEVEEKNNCQLKTTQFYVDQFRRNVCLIVALLKMYCCNK